MSNGVDSLNLSDDGSGESQPVNEEEEPNLLEQDQGGAIVLCYVWGYVKIEDHDVARFNFILKLANTTIIFYYFL